MKARLEKEIPGTRSELRVSVQEKKSKNADKVKMGQEDANEDVWSHQDKAEREIQATPMEEEIHQGGQWFWRDSDEPQQQIIDRYREGYVIFGTELCYTPQKHTSL